jgi:nicotinamide mononucleotide transporter
MKFTLIELLEIIVIITTLLYNYFLIKQQIICWLFGFLSSVTGLVIFYEKQLIGQVILHVFYALMALYGWYIWGKNKQELKVKKWTIAMQAYTLAFGFIISFSSFLLVFYSFLFLFSFFFLFLLFVVSLCLLLVVFLLFL